MPSGCHLIAIRLPAQLLRGSADVVRGHLVEVVRVHFLQSIQSQSSVINHSVCGQHLIELVRVLSLYTSARSVAANAHAAADASAATATAARRLTLSS